MARRAICRSRLVTALCWSIVAFGTQAAGADKPASDDPKIQAAINRAMAFLRQAGGGDGIHSDSLVALALLKSGEPVDSPKVEAGIERIQKRVQNGVYQPADHHYYVSGLDLMLLESADPEKYQTEMKAVLKYILDGQLANGSWYYPNQAGALGDTSITQYSMLGLWSAARAGLKIPLSVWDRAASWHIKTQLSTGGFAYHPTSGASLGAKPTMTAAAIGSLHIARLHLYPDRELTARQAKRKENQVSRIHRFLKPIDLDNPAASTKRRKQVSKPAGKPKTPLSAIDDAIKRGIAHLATDWSINNDGSHTHYYLYALERMTALADIHLIGEHDWYAEASAFLLRTQRSNGSWSSAHGPGVDTCFGLLCLGKATARMLNREEPSIGVGAGLLAGGRGLPENLSQVQVTDGKVKTRKLQSSLDQLLNELENPKSRQVETVQTAVLERVQLGNREELIGQTDRLVRLARDPRVEVRRVAIWALGHSGDVRYAPLLIAALQDANLDVLIEARNALCTLSRKPRGFGLPNHPYAGLSEESGEKDRSRQLKRWRAQSIAHWKQWYRAVEPYDERNGLPERDRR